MFTAARRSGAKAANAASSSKGLCRPLDAVERLSFAQGAKTLFQEAPPSLATGVR
jgi:hypothetical protein